MQRLTGIGVSPGVVSGRAVILIQREQVLRYHVPPQRLEHELARLEASRARARQQLTDIRGGVALRRGPDMASIFDAQLLMLDDPMLVPRAADIIRAQRVNAEWAIQRVFQEFSAVFDEIADPVPARAQGRRGGSGRPAEDESPAGHGHRPRPAARARRGVGADCRRADAVAGGADRLDQGARVCHRRRQPHVSLGDPGPVSRRAGRGRAVRCQPRDSAGSAGRHRRDRRAKSSSIRARTCSPGRRVTTTIGRRPRPPRTSGADRR